MALILNLLNVWLLLFVSIRLIKAKIDSSVIWYALVTLYFYAFPLLVDSIMLVFIPEIEWGQILEKYNKSFQSNFLSKLTLVSFHSLMFNLSFVAIYFIVNKNKKSQLRFPSFDGAIQNNYFYSWRFYICISYSALILFMFYNNIFSIVQMPFQWNSNSRNNPILNFIVDILVTVSPMFILRGLYEKKYLLSLFTLIPTVIIGYITLSRALIIAAIFYFLYFFVWKAANVKVNFKIIFKLLVIALSFSILLTVFRGSDATTYPLYRDVSYSDLFYSYANQSGLSTGGNNFIRLLLTGFYDYQTEDITKKIAEYKFGSDWGTLHPTVLGWAYVDLKNFFWLLSLFLGILIGLCDRLRYSLPIKVNFMINAFLFSFISVAIRGSVQYAYSNLFYPIILFFFIYIFKRLMK